MGEPGPRPSDKPAVTGVFDVREWLADLTGVGDWLVNHTFTRKKIEFVASYAAAGGATAQITLRALPTVGNASWELLADLNERQARVVIPARTRIKW
jgi:hypothetical protein